MFKKILVIFFLLLFPCFANADTIRMYSPKISDIVWDLSELKYERTYYNGQFVWEVLADNFGYYEGSKYIDTSDMPKGFDGYIYYVIKGGWVQCFYMYDHTLISNIYYDKETKSMYEYKPGAFNPKKELIAIYKPINEDEFNKLDSEGNIISKFSRKNNTFKYWTEYNPDGTVKTRHLTRFLPFSP